VSEPLFSMVVAAPGTGVSPPSPAGAHPTWAASRARANRVPILLPTLAFTSYLPERDVETRPIISSARYRMQLTLLLSPKRACHPRPLRAVLHEKGPHAKNGAICRHGIPTPQLEQALIEDRAFFDANPERRDKCEERTHPIGGMAFPTEPCRSPKDHASGCACPCCRAAVAPEQARNASLL